MKASGTHILVTIDVEDWFQVENFKPWIPFSAWDSHELRVEKNVHRLLDLFDSLSSTCNQHPEIRCTFFILGWLAKRLPKMVREIHERGHEIASHGYFHNLCTQQAPKDLKADLTNSKKLLEDLIGEEVYGYRAPSFSIDDNVLKIIEDSGYLYDSSYNSFALHGRYGKLETSGHNSFGAFQVLEKFYKLPISNLNVGRLVFPWGGGGYFRIIPLQIYKQGVEAILRHQNVYVFYMHPWEIDPDQPRVEAASPAYKFRHYTNLNRTYSKLTALIQSFSHHEFITCRGYLRATQNAF